MCTLPDNDSNESGRASKLLKRACDCCRKRKVKCDGANPCGPCRKASITCAYLQPSRKKGPKGLRSARVLHALRMIDQSATTTPDGTLSPALPQDGLSQYSWSSTPSPTMPTSVAYGDAQIPTSVPTHLVPDHGFITSESQAYTGPPPAGIGIMATNDNIQTWAAQLSSQQFPMAILGPQPALARISNDRFLPYVRLFFQHLFSIMPVIDKHVFLNPHMYDPSNILTTEVYAFLCALCAATIVQLDAATQLPETSPLPGRPMLESDMFIEECLKTRQEYDYIEHPTTLTVMTSFFIFAFWGNCERSEKAWYYIQESISFAENLSIDDEIVMLKLDPIEAQWRRRLYWLLFITERAYSIQRRKNCRLQPSVHLPLAFEHEDPRLLHGFVNLAHLFSAIDDSFVSIWKGARRRSLCSSSWLAETQRSLDAVALALDDITETQKLDISISREWLHVLAWQMGVSNGLAGESRGAARLDYPIELARRTVCITEGANQVALDSHGIGMEQKLSDIAGCLADVLRVSGGDMSAGFLVGRRYLHLMIHKLSRMRGKESRYLRPLVVKAGDLLEGGVPRAITLVDEKEEEVRGKEVLMAPRWVR